MKISPLFVTAFIAFFIIVAASLNAEQVTFKKQLVEQEDGLTYQFRYQWLDQDNNQQSLAFHLPQQVIFDRYRNFRSFKNDIAQQSIKMSLQKHFKKNPITGVQIQFEPNSNSLRAKIQSKDKVKVNQAYAKINELEQELTKEYLQKSYYHQFITYDNIQAIKPDHSRIANESVADLKPIKPLILAKASIKNIRKVTNYVLGFIQSIPYSTLESRITSSGAGFSPPLKLLWENQGDCDSKVTLTAALLRSLMPRINMALIFIDNHALIGIEIMPEGDDLTITVDKVTYVLAEPTGPALLKLGKVAIESEQAILAGHYSAEKFHSQP